jgi:hypothetical protein
MSTLRFEPLIPGALWMALAVAGAALLAFYALRRRPDGVGRGRWAAIVGLMTSAVALVLAVLLNPTWVREIPPPAGKPLLTVLVDSSGSMLTPDAQGQPRYDAAVGTASEIVDDLSERFQVRVRTFAEAGASDADLQQLPAQRPAGPLTDLAGGIAGTLNEDRPHGQAVVVLSDGIHNAPGGSGAQRVLEAARAARAVGAPLYTRTFGSAEAAGFDLRVEMRASQDLAFIGQRLAVTARVLSPGIAGGRANVVLLHDGVEVGREAVDLSPERAVEARFWVSRDATGVFAYEARVEPLPGELTQANNAAPYLLRVVDQPVRVLQLEGKPYWDSKFLLRTLAAVPAVEIDSVVRVAEGRYLKRTLKRGEKSSELGVQSSGNAGGNPVTAPAASSPELGTLNSELSSAKVHDWKIVGDPAEVLGDADALKSYQVIVLGRDAEQFLTGVAMDRLQAWVSREGGSLVCYRGSPTVQAHERLARLLPVRWTPSHEGRFRMKLTPDGQNLQWFGGAGPGGATAAGAGGAGGGKASPDAPQAVLASLPTLASRAQVDRAKPLAVVLATAVSPDGAEGAPAAAPGAPAEQPAVVYQPYGTGRVVVVEGSGMWRWAFLPPKFKGQEEVYASLWHSMLRWLISAENLMPGQKLSLRADKVSFNSTEPATATLLVRDEAAAKGKAPMVELVSGGGADGAGGEVKAFAAAPLGEEPGTFRVNFGKLPEGRYVLRVAGAPAEEAFARTVFGVRTVGEEQLNLKPRADLMARLAADSGGKVLESGDGREIAEAFRAHMAALRPPRFERATAWDRWWVLVAVIALWGLSWALRRSAGLV